LPPTLTAPANGSTALRAILDPETLFVLNRDDLDITWKWTPEGSRYESTYRINFRRDGGDGQPDNRIINADETTPGDVNIGWENAWGSTPFGQLEATYAHTTYGVRNFYTIEARMVSCNRSGCSGNSSGGYSNVIKVNIVPPPPGSRTISTINLGVSNTEIVDTSQDPQYRQITNSSASVKYYRLRGTGGTGNASLSIVDGNDNAITTDVVTGTNQIIFKLDPSQTRYIKFLPTHSGSYNHILYQYSSFPPYEGL
jgi:hypothetical protein